MAQGIILNRIKLRRVLDALLVAGVMALAPAVLSSQASAQALSYAPAAPASFPSDNFMAAPDSARADEGVSSYVLPERLRRTIVALDTSEAPGTVIIDTGNTVLYYVLGQGRAIRYGVGVGREGFTWSGVQTISHKAEWPDWHPPAQMIARQPYLAALHGRRPRQSARRARHVSRLQRIPHPWHQRSHDDRKICFQWLHPADQ